MLRSTAAATRRARVMKSANFSGVSACALSDFACDGWLCTSISRPSAPAAMAASAISGHVAPIAGGVAGVEDDRQVRMVLDHRDGVDVGGEAGGGFEGDDAALAEDHLRVAFGHDIFGGHQQILDAAAEAALEQHGDLHAPHAFAAGGSSAYCARRSAARRRTPSPFRSRRCPSPR